jgi:D-glycero-alpha-D-manno-heptose-7-phosphate kinase
MRPKASFNKIIARAPLRLGFAGGGTDVSPFSDRYGGFVLNAAINWYAHATITPRDDDRVELHSADLKVSWNGPAAKVLPVTKGLELHTGVYNRMLREFGTGGPLSVSIETRADAPPGSGLGSSSTMVVALVQALCEYLTVPLAAHDNAHLAYEIERGDLGFAGGKQDHYTAAFGGLNFMEFYAERVIVNPLPIEQKLRAELESSLVLAYVATPRESARIMGEQVQNVNRGNQNALQAMHVLKAQAVRMKEAVLHGDFDALVNAMQASWAAKKQIANGISNPRIDEMYEVAMKAGARAGKVSGAGGGGFMMFIVDPLKRERVMNCVQEFAEHVSTCRFVERGVLSWKVM